MTVKRGVKVMALFLSGLLALVACVSWPLSYRSDLGVQCLGRESYSLLMARGGRLCWWHEAGVKFSEEGVSLVTHNVPARWPDNRSVFNQLGFVYDQRTQGYSGIELTVMTIPLWLVGLAAAAPVSLYALARCRARRRGFPVEI